MSKNSRTLLISSSYMKLMLGCFDKAHSARVTMCYFERRRTKMSLTYRNIGMKNSGHSSSYFVLLRHRKALASTGPNGDLMAIIVFENAILSFHGSFYILAWHGGSEFFFITPYRDKDFVQISLPRVSLEQQEVPCKFDQYINKNLWTRS